MSETVKRSYRSPLREESARRTRAAIRLAARAEFLRTGYVSTTMRRVAAAAGVAERTLYAAYPTKLALFRAVLDDAAVGSEQPVTPADVPEFVAAVEDGDTARVATVVADVAVRLVERIGELVMTMLESSGADEDMRQQAEWGFRQSREDAGRVCAALAKAGLLRPGLDVPAAADELHVLCSPQVHDLLRSRHGWSGPRYRRWVEDGVARLLVERTPASGAAGRPTAAGPPDGCTDGAH